MPHKNLEEKRAYARAWYAAHRDRVMAAHRKYRLEHCVGTCVNCGGPTYGDRPKRVPSFCAKPECASAQRKADSRAA